MAQVSDRIASLGTARVFARYFYNDQNRLHQMANGLFMPGRTHDDYRRRLQQIMQQRPPLAKAAIAEFGQGEGDDMGRTIGGVSFSPSMQSTMETLEQQAMDRAQGVMNPSTSPPASVKTLSDGSPDNRQFDEAVQKLAEETAAQQFEQRVEEEVQAQIEAQELVSMDELYRMARLIAAKAVTRIIAEDPELNGGRGRRSRRRFY